MEITLESIFQLFAESERQRAAERAESEKQRVSYEAQRAAAIIEYEKNRAESEKLFNERLEKHRIDNAKFIKEMNRELNKKIGSLTDIFGMYAQTQTKERIVKMFAKRGIILDSTATNYKQEDGKGGFIYEIDILLYNTIYAIVVEVKNHLKKDDIDEHLERMEKCIAFPPKGTKGTSLLGGVATMIISEEVERYAKKKGLYIIKPSGKSVKIANEVGFKHAEWITPQ
jgi:hypothetical protein